MTVAVVDWSVALRAKDDIGKDASYCPKVSGPKGGRLKIYDIMYHDGTFPPNYPVPAIQYTATWGDTFMWGTVYIERHNEYEPVMVSVYDELFDRCLDFGTPYMEFYFL